MARDIRFIGPYERLLYMRSLADFTDASASDLSALAQRARERSFRRGSVLVDEGQPTFALYFVVEGRVTVSRAGDATESLEGPVAVGMLEALSQAPSPTEVRAETDVLTLELAADDLIDTLEDHFALFSRCLRMVGNRMIDAQLYLEPHGAMPRSEPADVPYPERELDLVQRIVLMRSGPAFARCNLDALAEIARANKEIRVEPGTVLFREGEPSEASFNVVYGVVDCVGEDPPRKFRMGPGSIVGNLEVMAGRKRSYTATASTKLVMLRYEWEALLDVLEDHFDVGFGMLSFLSGTLLRLLGLKHRYERRSVPPAAP